jgi:hypothetical protein
MVLYRFAVCSRVATVVGFSGPERRGIGSSREGIVRDPDVLAQL